MNVRRLNWEKLNIEGKIEGTIWGQIRRLDALDSGLDVPNMEERFSTQKPKHRPSFVEKKRAQVKKTFSIMGEKKAYNIGTYIGYLR
jgi:hypothetical protein